MQEEATASFRSSPQQEALWLKAPDGPSGRNQLIVALEGPIDVERLHEAVAGTVERHEILRTTFQRRSGMRVPLQVVHDRLPPTWNVVDSSDEALPSLGAADRAAPVSFGEGPVLRATLAVLGAERAALILTVPSVSADGASLATLAEEIASRYAGDAPADEPLQYADFAAWQHELAEADDGDAERGRTFWAELAESTAAPAVPFLRPSEAHGLSEREPIPLSAESVAALERRAEKFGVAPELVALAAWHVVLRLISGTNPIDVSAVLPGRLHAELDGAVGALARPVPVRVSIDERDTFAEVVDRVARAAGKASSWQDYAPEVPSAGAGFVAAAAMSRVNAGDVAFAPHELTLAADGSLVGVEWVPGAGTLTYDAGAYAASEAVRLAAHVARVLSLVVDRPDLTLDEIDLVGEDERGRVLHQFNDTRSETRAATVDALVREAAAKRPQQRAVVDEDGEITYEQLDARANQLAHRLRELAVGPGTVVGLCTDRSVDMVVGLLGILRAGGAYLPLHFEHPAARLGHQIAETSAPVLVTQSALLDRLPQFEGTTIRLDTDRADLDARPASAPEAVGGPDDLVYVMYTSGSTGTPKGVAVTNANLVNYVTEMIGRLEAADEPLTFALLTAISTDLGNTSVFPALCSGGTLSLISPGVAADPGGLAARMRKEPVDVVKITPSHLSALLASADAALLPRKTLVLGGEACSWDIVARVRELSDCRILNHYGPTETTIGSCVLEVDDGPGVYAPMTVPIGRPIRNTACFILDGRGRPAAIGVAGALFIGGAGVARGYVGQDALTAERFVTDPFGVAEGSRMYATGDLARWLPDGRIEFLGRADEQVKIRGFRVEPSEIEATLRKLSGVREAAVVAREEPSGEKRLVAYVVGDSIGADALRAHVADWVPEFMVPSAFVALDELPRTPSGKIDRLALPEPDVVAITTETYVAPRTPVEEKLAAIWADVLHVERVGIRDDFFALGGHSLLATQIVAQIRTDFAVDLPLHSLFMTPTVESLAQTVGELLGADADPETGALLAELEGMSDEEAARLLGETGGDAT